MSRTIINSVYSEPSITRQHLYPLKNGGKQGVVIKRGLHLKARHMYCTRLIIVFGG